MIDQDVSTALEEELHRIAPDVSLADIDLAGDLREEFDIDSMDFLTLVTALGKRFNLDMPEADYPKMQSFNALTDYLIARKA
ncbi:phosphopantetheine-binding protein (plasmid) [Sulfitobacter sp. SK012]|uniref:acyl carrier protein n=1 Tax=Sulfitobacter sp. SK012 TaxID=1389005 RepID=UPI000E09FD62|nr:acyl carrier protein [Sulfitobacter sp. SK012]AXI49173.1 phosphopantetheine-binding protein [Sulfitobacter sp. SK012]